MSLSAALRSSPSALALSKLALGSGFGYALALLLSPALTRLYSPSEFGTFAIFGAIVAILSIFGTFSFELAVLGSRTRAEALRFVSVAVSSILIICSVATALLLVLMAIEITLPLAWWAILAALLSCLFASLTHIGINWAIRNDRSGVAARATFTSLVGRSGLQVVFGFGLGGIAGLVVGELVGRFAAWLVADRGILRSGLRRLRGHRALLRRDFHRESDYAVFVTPGVALDVSLVWLPAPLFALFFDPIAGGFVALVQRLGSAPLTIANQSLGQLFHRRAGQIAGTQKGRLLKFLAGTVALTLPMAVAIGVVLLWSGEPIVAFVLGAEWGAAGLVALAYLPLYYVQFLSLMTNRLMLILGRFRLRLFASTVHLALMLAAIAVCSSLATDWMTAVAVQALVLAISHFAVFLIVVWLLWRNPVPADVDSLQG